MIAGGVIAIDTSAIVAMIRREPEWAAFASVLATANEIYISAVSVLEASMVLVGGQGGESERSSLDTLLDRLKIEIIPFDAAQARLAQDAFMIYGKGRGDERRGRSAGLNFGDCASYALAKARSVPLLFKGDDFAHTDVTPAV
ncbi:MAG TPA: type II toxin-antitoxin system VapC family toxin [Stellaceae bacterium]|nr:type II toxin-antitoxin system VapC family toxin [Stellaceae bacterium]